MKRQFGCDKMNYTFKDVFLALREEYKKTNQDVMSLLETLKLGPKATYHHFDLDKMQWEEGCRLFLGIRHCTGISLGGHLHLGNYPGDITEFNLDDYGHDDVICFPKTKQVAYTIVDYDAFKEKLRSLKESAFARNITTGTIIVNNDSEELLLLISVNGIHLLKDGFVRTIDYVGSMDMVMLKGYEDEALSYFKKVLDLPLDIDSLSLYHKQIITSYQPKELVFADDTPNDLKSLAFIEEPKKLVLKGTNKAGYHTDLL